MPWLFIPDSSLIHGFALRRIIPSQVGSQPQSTGAHRCSTEAPPVDHCGGIRRFCDGHRWTTGGGTHSPTRGHRLFYRWYKDDAGPAKIGRNQHNYRAKIKKAQISRKPLDSNLLLNTIEIYIWHQNQ